MKIIYPHLRVTTHLGTQWCDKLPIIQWPTPSVLNVVCQYPICFSFFWQADKDNWRIHCCLYGMEKFFEHSKSINWHVKRDREEKKY